MVGWLTGELPGQTESGAGDLCTRSSSTGAAAAAIIVDGAGRGTLDDAVIVPIFIVVIDTKKQ